MCSFCQSYIETIPHLFCECQTSKTLYLEIAEFLKRADIYMPSIDEIAVIYEQFDDEENTMIIGHLLNIYKQVVYGSRDIGYVNINMFLAKVKEVQKIEYNIAQKKDKVHTHSAKWEKIIQFL